MRSLDLETAYPSAAAVTPNDGADLPGGVARGGLWVGGTGAVVMDDAAGNTITISAVPAGARVPVQARRVRATGTVATAIVALYTETIKFA